MPVGVGGCLMNKICCIFEDEFDEFVARNTKQHQFDYRFMRTDAEYTTRQFNAVKQLYEEYCKRRQNFEVYKTYERVDKDDALATYSIMNEEFIRECSIACPNEDALCNIVLDLCYTKARSKSFAWCIAGRTIVKNLIAKNGGCITYPSIDPNGDIYYCGNRFTVKRINVEVTE